MKIKQILAEGWRLAQLHPQDTLDLSQLESLHWMDVPYMPMQAQDVLLAHGLLPEEVLVGWCDEAVWVADYDWVYRCEFAPEDREKPAILKLFGIDTIADVYVNGKKIASHDDFYLPCIVGLGDGLLDVNTLIVHFHNIEQAQQERYYNPEWEGMVDHWKVVRKPGHDRVTPQEHGSNYQGAHPYFTPIGLYDDVVIEYPDKAEIVGDHLTTALDSGYINGHIGVRLETKTYQKTGSLYCAAKVQNAEGTIVDESIAPVNPQGIAFCSLGIESPELWYPRGFGAQPLYTVTLSLYAEGQSVERASVPLDVLRKQVGFKDVRMDGAFDFVINGKTVRLWGGSMDPFQGYTHCWQSDRVKRLLDMVENANMNLLRCWGEGIPYKDTFYEACNQRGILVWQEFFMGFGAYPDTDAYRAYCIAEGEFLIKRIRHHACLLMWCGGNETRMGAEYTDRTRPFYGEAIIRDDFPALVARLDPGRYYHESSPSGGEWANDPYEGDHHTYDCIWSYRGGEYPNMVSEHIRTSPPVMHSLKAIVREKDFWPDTYTGMMTYKDRFPLPDSWMERTHWGAFMDLKTGPIWEYHDANTPEEMLYRFGAAYGLEMRRGLERVRMGSLQGGLNRDRRSRGHLSCKLNDTWPKCYCAIIDFFGEGYMPYYATKRGQEPVLLCFDFHDHINLWLVNDSAEDIEGVVHFALFDPIKNEFTNEIDFQIRMPQGQSDIVTNLDFLKFFRKYHLLYARFTDMNNNVRSSVIDTVDIERHMRFPEAKLDVQVDGDALLIATDQFARCIEIQGNADGNPFGWMFEDNYFDLLPGETKRVRILGEHRKGFVSLKPHFSPHQVVLSYEKRGE